MENCLNNKQTKSVHRIAFLQHEDIDMQMNQFLILYTDVVVSREEAALHQDEGGEVSYECAGAWRFLLLEGGCFWRQQLGPLGG